MVPHVWTAYIAKRCRNNLGVLVTYSILRGFDNPSVPGMCFPRLDGVAALTPYAVRTIQRHIATLERIGTVEVERRPGTSSVYRFPTDPPAAWNSEDDPTTSKVSLHPDSTTTTPMVSSPHDTDDVVSTHDSLMSPPHDTTVSSPVYIPVTDQKTNHHHSAPEHEASSPLPEPLVIPMVVADYLRRETAKRRKASLGKEFP